MGNLRVGLSLNSTDLLSSALNISVATSLIVDSGSLIRAKVKGTDRDSDDLAIYIVNQCSDRAYLYIKNLDSQLENYIYMRSISDSANVLVAKVGGGEFAFIPVAVDKKYSVYGTKIDTLIEYGVFGNDNSAAPYGGT